MTNAPDIGPVRSSKIARFYELVARCLPTEGRDYTVSFSDDPSEKDGVVASIQGITEIGLAFVRHVVSEFKKQKED